MGSVCWDVGISRHRYVYPNHRVFSQQELRQSVGVGEALVDDIFLFSIVFSCFLVLCSRSCDLERRCDKFISSGQKSLLVPHLLRAAVCGIAVSGGGSASVEPTATRILDGTCVGSVVDNPDDELGEYVLQRVFTVRDALYRCSVYSVIRNPPRAAGTLVGDGVDRQLGIKFYFRFYYRSNAMNACIFSDFR